MSDVYTESWPVQQKIHSPTVSSYSIQYMVLILGGVTPGSSQKKSKPRHTVNEIWLFLPKDSFFIEMYS